MEVSDQFHAQTLPTGGNAPIYPGNIAWWSLQLAMKISEAVQKNISPLWEMNPDSPASQSSPVHSPVTILTEPCQLM